MGGRESGMILGRAGSSGVSPSLSFWAKSLAGRRREMVSVASLAKQEAVMA